MADDPMTVDSASADITLVNGVVLKHLLVSGPADYDAATGAAFDISTYVSDIYQCTINSVTSVNDCGVQPRYLNTDFTAPAGGLVVFHWAADGVDGEVLAEVADTTDLSEYQWQVTLIGAPA